jgi:hypothetical protein
MPIQFSLARLAIPDPAQRQLDPMIWLGYEVRDNLPALHADVVHILLAGCLVTKIFQPLGVLLLACLCAPIDRRLDRKLIEELVMLKNTVCCTLPSSSAGELLNVRFFQVNGHLAIEVRSCDRHAGIESYVG